MIDMLLLYKCKIVIEFISKMKKNITIRPNKTLRLVIRIDSTFNLLNVLGQSRVESMSLDFCLNRGGYYLCLWTGEIATS